MYFAHGSYCECLLKNDMLVMIYIKVEEVQSYDGKIYIQLD